MEHNLYGLKNEFSDQGIFFCLSGPISQKLVTDIGAILEQKMKMENASRSTVIRVFALVVEKVQNIIHYSDEKSLNDDTIDLEVGVSFGVIAVGYKDNHYFVLSGNMIENQKIDRLQEKLTKIQHMSKDELKQYYREKRRQKPGDESRGAGLGFLEMAKKASSPLEFEFRPIDDSMSFFTIKTTI
jgi:hypothetical protein